MEPDLAKTKAKVGGEERVKSRKAQPSLRGTRVANTPAGPNDASDDEDITSTVKYCLEEVIEEMPDEAYCFNTKSLNQHVESRVSLTELKEKWGLASRAEKSDRSKFPETRKKNVKKTLPFQTITVECTCLQCQDGTPKRFQCKPFAFGDKGDMILILPFDYGENEWAFILSDHGDDPPRYRLWGAVKDDDPNEVFDCGSVEVQEVTPYPVVPASVPRSERYAARQQNETANKQGRKPRAVADDSIEEAEFTPAARSKRKRASPGPNLMGCQKKGRKSGLQLPPARETLTGTEGKGRRPGLDQTTPGNASSLASKGVKAVPASTSAAESLSATMERLLSAEPNDPIDDPEELSPPSQGDQNDVSVDESTPASKPSKGYPLNNPLATQMPFVPPMAQMKPPAAIKSSTANKRSPVEGLNNFNFDKAYKIVRKHLMFQQRPSDGLTFDAQNEDVKLYLQKLKSLRDRQDKFTFEETVDVINDDLVEAGFPELPELWE